MVFRAFNRTIPILSLFWLASFALTVLPEFTRNYQALQIGSPDAGPIGTKLGVVMVAASLAFGPPGFFTAIAAMLAKMSTRTAPVRRRARPTASPRRRRTERDTA